MIRYTGVDATTPIERPRRRPGLGHEHGRAERHDDLRQRPRREPVREQERHRHRGRSGFQVNNIADSDRRRGLHPGDPGATPTGGATGGNDLWVAQTVALKPADQGTIELRKEWVGTPGNATLSIETEEPIGAGVRRPDANDRNPVERGDLHRHREATGESGGRRLPARGGDGGRPRGEHLSAGRLDLDGREDTSGVAAIA